MNQWSGQLSLAPKWPDTVNAYVLAAGVAEGATVPAGAKWVVFSAPVGVDFFVSYTATAVIPVADITDGTGCEQNPGARSIGGVTTISIISAVGAIITLAFFA